MTPTTAPGPHQVQRAPDSTGPEQGSGGADALQAASREPGVALDAPIRRQVERVTGADLSSARVHTGASSQAAARSIQARAYTTGQDIHFGAGQYRPGTATGDRLIAHELVHTIQQGAAAASAPQAKLEISHPGDAAEVEADRIAALATEHDTGERAPGVETCPACGAAGDCACQPGAQAVQPAPVQRRIARAVIQRDGEETMTSTQGPAVPQQPGGAGPGTPGGAPGTCPDPAEQARKDAFRGRTDMQLANHIPSTGLGKFDCKYFPANGLMPVTVKIHFDFVEADNTPDIWDRMSMLLQGQDISQFFWSDAEKQDYQNQFISRVQARWSNQHTIRSIKPCWTEFFAIPVVTPQAVDDKAQAHYAITVHKVPAGIEYKSGLHNEHLLDSTAQPTGDLYSSDNTENPNFNSGDVATTERQRIEAGLTASAASPTLFDRDSDTVSAAAQSALTAFGNTLNQANPSAPLIPINLVGSASAEGNATHNQDLSERRAHNVAAVLRGMGVRQPLADSGVGGVGSPGDAANRKVEITVDHTFETTYASNRYSVSEHEFGHMLGMPDEYSDYSTMSGAHPKLVNTQTQYNSLVTSAGLSAPAYGQNTSSIMSAGVDVLPRHYVTLWEALGKMTAPDLTQSDWSLTA